MSQNNNHTIAYSARMPINPYEMTLKGKRTNFRTGLITKPKIHQTVPMTRIEFQSFVLASGVKVRATNAPTQASQLVMILTITCLAYQFYEKKACFVRRSRCLLEKRCASFRKPFRSGVRGWLSGSGILFHDKCSMSGSSPSRQRFH